MAAAATSGLGRRIVDANVRLSGRIERTLRLPSDKPLWERFHHEAADRIASLPHGSPVIDLGGGRRCVYAGALKPGQDVKLVAVDISAEELALNDAVDETLVADVAEHLPVPPGSVDVITSRMCLEHVDGVRAAARNMAAALRPGGVALHMLPCRYALFAMAARWLPFGPLVGALHRVMPWTVDEVEFEVFYDQGTPRRMERAFREAGFTQVEVEVAYGQPGYFEWCVPLFLLHGAYASLVQRLGARPLASYMVVRAVR